MIPHLKSELHNKLDLGDLGDRLYISTKDGKYKQEK